MKLLYAFEKLATSVLSRKFIHKFDAMHAGFPTVAAVYDRRFYGMLQGTTGGHRPPLQWKNGPEYLSEFLTQDARAARSTHSWNDEQLTLHQFASHGLRLISISCETARTRDSPGVADQTNEPWRNRTSNLLIKSQLLCQLS